MFFLVFSRVGPDMIFFAGCRISGWIIRRALPDIAEYPASGKKSVTGTLF